MSASAPAKRPSAPAGRASAASNERPIRFIHRQRVVEVSGLAPTTTVLAWLREHAGCTGTKEGCNEGDCGACTVAVAERDLDGNLIIRNLNACLLYLPVLDGKALFTVEDLQGLCGGALHPVQQALVTHHGSQCGFCTPGFVMTMWTEWEKAQHSGATPSRQDWADALAGNLCRCTGYRPILDAAQSSLGGDGLSDGSAAGGAEGASSQACESRLDRTALVAQLAALDGRGSASDLQRPTPSYAAPDPAFGEVRAFSAPRSSDELAACLVAHPGARVLGGATDIGLWTNKGHRDVGHLVFTGAATDLRAIDERDGGLRIGGAATLEDAWRALAQHWPVLGDLWRRFASPPVRHAGTLAGNVANGSPIGDGPPILMALQARLVLRVGAQRRTVPLDEFYLGYQRNALQPGEFIEWIEVPLPAAGQVFRAWKISKRYDSDISAVCAGFGLRFAAGVDAPAELDGAVLAFGGMAATVGRARGAEAALLQHGWCEAGIAAAQAALKQDFQPLSDLRATAAYRIEAAQALLQRLWLSVQGDAAGHAADKGASAIEHEALRLEVWR